MATSSSCFSLVSMFESYLRKIFISSGLTPKSINIDSDTTLHYWSPKQPSKLPPLILLHGFGGHSRSETFQAVSMGKLLELLYVARYSVLGTSYVGFVAYHMARLRPDRVEKVIIVNSAINLRRKDSEELMKKAKIEKIESLFMPESPAELLTCIRLINHKKFPIYIPEFSLNDVLNKLCNENRKEKLELLEGTTVGKEDIVSILPLQQPLVITPLKKGYELKELIGDKVRMEIMLKASHTPQSEKPKQFNDVVMKFLTGKPVMATSSPCFSLVSMYESYLRNTFTSSGLTPKSINIDSETNIHYWSPIHPLTLPTLVLLHVQHLSTHFTLYVPDLIFFGKSVTKSSERSEIFQAVSVGKLLELLGVTKYSVMKVVIANSDLNITSKDVEELLKETNIENIESVFMPSSPAELLTCIRLTHKQLPIYIPEFLLNDFLNNLCNENRKEKLELLKGTTVGKQDTISILPLKQEVLLIWGENDSIFPLEKGYEFKDLLGEKVRMEVMLKTSHTPQLENPKQFNDIVMKFLLGMSSSS
ncbi:hypothetical protein MKX03_023435 [Papaver bracteatum]|nr:hypothetical protein MKX03_023435 [Papaver bracteatum]